MATRSSPCQNFTKNSHSEREIVFDSFNTVQDQMSASILALNELLLTKAEKSPNVTVHFDHKLLQANFIFGCAAHSTVRRQMMRWGRLNYQQEYIEHGYKKLTMPATRDGESAMEPNFLHIWPHHENMMIALPNPNKSFTHTLFMPFTVFESDQDLLSFFTK